ncbi:MAG TPA: hypothetical protein ENN41_09715 [Sediminispirochaeta sp.]|nr:hypothetical protein [Sediminispirochaeta sp.]
MVNTTKPIRILCASIIFFSLAGAVHALEEHAQKENTTHQNTLLNQDIPLFYGEELFRERIAKPFSGRPEPFGLLLSGGSARAFAHIGVLKALEERDLSPDFIVTNSMGSIVGILYAAGFSPDEIISLIKGVKLSTLFEPVVPLRGGLLNTRFFTELMSQFIPYSRIESLPIPILVVAEDLASKRTVILAEGDLEQVLAAAFALPIFFEPVDFGPHRLIDGGISNIVPADLAYRYSDQIIISTTFYGKSLNLNNPFTILNVAIDITKARAGIRAIKRYQPIWIRCDVEHFSFMDWRSLDEIILRGYASALVQLDSQEAVESIPQVPLDYLQNIRDFGIEHVRNAARDYQRSSAVFYSPVDWGFGAGIQSTGGPEVRYRLQSRNRFQTGPYLNGGYLSLQQKFFYQPRWFNNYQQPDGSFSGISFEADWTPLGRLLLHGAADLNFEDRIEFSSLYLRGETGLPLLTDNFSLSPLMRGEVFTDEGMEIDGSLVLAGVSLRNMPSFDGNTNISIEGGLMYQDHNPAWHSEAQLSIDLLPVLKLSQRLLARMETADGEGVLYYPGDYYRGSWQRQELPSFLVGNSSLALTFPDWKPSFGELVILDALRFGPFLDTRVTEDRIEYMFGAELDIALSLIGLKPLRLHLDYGFLQGTEGRLSFFLAY